ncbi:MAG TPA: tetratricopeptide repeat protein [Gemmatimonadales bacterium]|nr:tetratricopeptide repeat protein [Gemmatimonadales bacterium]
MRAGWALLAVIVAGAACASPSDVRQVQDEVAQLRAQTARQDSARAARLSEIIRTQQRIMDSLEATRMAVRTLKGDTQQDLYNVQQQLLQLQELTGQSQRRLTELRTQLDQRADQIAASKAGAPPGATGAPTDSTQPTAPGGAATAASADQMYEASVAQLRRGSTATARTGLRQLLQSYPTSERVPDALYFMGQSFAAENPDSAAYYYNLVVQSHPQSPRASAALYNLGLLAERRKDNGAARDAYQRVIQKYPRSDEAALARDRLKALGR